MGALNVTLDSFSDGGHFFGTEDALAQVNKMVAEGADIIDIGGESTRPGSVAIDAKEELKRVMPVLKGLKGKISVPISIDTYKAEVAEKALASGASIVNDIWGLQKDPPIADVAAKYKVPVIIMHNQEGTHYTGDIVKEICKFFEHSLEIAFKAGIKKEFIILDPGIGFGKTFEQNKEVMLRLDEFNTLGYPVLLGVSRKSMIGYILNLPVDERLEGTLAATVIGVAKGAKIIRVHDVKENLRALRVADALIRAL